MTGDEQVDDAAVREALAIVRDLDRLELVMEIFDEGTTSVYELASDAAPEDEAGLATVELHHHHLPMLDDAGWIEYDEESGRVDPTDPDTVREALTAASNQIDYLDDRIDQEVIERVEETVDEDLDETAGSQFEGSDVDDVD